jgi:hypothetical protein
MFKCINNLAPEYLCSIFNSINENCPCGLKSATSNDSATVIAKIMNSEVISNDRCCGEAGTFAVARPDIAKQVKFRKPWHWPFARIHQIFVDSHSTNNWVARQL